MAGRLVVELESIHLTAKKPYFRGLKAFAVLHYKNEEKRGQPRKLLGIVSNWGETFDFDVEGNPKADCIWMDVYKEKNKFDKLIGTCKILLYDATAQRGEPSRLTFQLSSDGKTEKESKASNMGHMTILVRYYPSAPQLEAALEKAEERVLKLERALQLKLEHQRLQNVGEAATSSGNAVTSLMCSDNLAATISKVEQLRFQTQVRKLENEMKWAENEMKWAENEMKWAENDARWGQDHGKWAANDIKWDENNVKFAENQAHWAETEAKFAQIQAEDEATLAQIQGRQNQSLLEMCKVILKADLLNFGCHLKMLIVGFRIWLIGQITYLYEKSLLDS